MRISARLTASPVCLVVEEHEFSPMLERAIYRGLRTPKIRRVLEINPKHSLISRMLNSLVSNPENSFLPKAAELLLGLALLSEGSELSDPVRFIRAATDVLNQAMQ